MDTTASALSSVSVAAPAMLAAAAVAGRRPKCSSMDAEFITRETTRDDIDSIMTAPNDHQPGPTVAFPARAGFASNLIPPTPPTVSSTRAPDATPADVGPSKGNPRQTRPQLTSRMSSRQGGKRHASIGSQREMPFPSAPAATTTGSATIESPTHSLGSHAATASVDQPQHGWSRLMGLHIPGLSPSTPRTPKSGSMSSTAGSPKSPDEQRAASYFSFRRRNSVSPAVSPGKSLASGKIPSATATPPPPPPPPAPPSPAQKPSSAPMATDEKKSPAPPRQHHSPISEESSPTTPISPKPRRANLSLDLGTTLAQRGSTSSLPLIGHTPVETLVAQESKPRRASAMIFPPAAPPPHIHTPPVHPPAYEYPFLPHHAPRKPLEIRVEEIPPAVPGTMEGGSWVITVRLPGFHPDGITIGTRRGRVLVIVADNYNDNDDGGHFERRISFGYDADMANIRAEFNGDMLKVTVPRRAIFGLTSMS